MESLPSMVPCSTGFWDVQSGDSHHVKLTISALVGMFPLQIWPSKWPPAFGCFWVFFVSHLDLFAWLLLFCSSVESNSHAKLLVVLKEFDFSTGVEQRPPQLIVLCRRWRLTYLWKPWEPHREPIGMQEFKSPEAMSERGTSEHRLSGSVSFWNVCNETFWYLKVIIIYIPFHGKFQICHFFALK